MVYSNKSASYILRKVIMEEQKMVELLPYQKLNINR